MPAEAAPPVCVVTGSASGIGLALVHRLLRDGWQVVGIDQAASPPGLDDARYRHHRLALDDQPAVAAWCRAEAPHFGVGGLTALVHGAGVVRASDVADFDAAQADFMWRLHVTSVSTLCQGLQSCLADGRGRVVLVSSRAVLGRAGRSAYASTKAAQIGLARSLAAEWVSRGITVNVVAPGATDTPMLRDPQRGLPPKVDLPIGRLVTADEAAGSIAFFLGPDAGAITGQTLYVCGGASLGISALL
jgi:NAD(P)-dependent dehydrogenase (short-subunit alcohol dehydrogenase family)